MTLEIFFALLALGSIALLFWKAFAPAVLLCIAVLGLSFTGILEINTHDTDKVVNEVKRSADDVIDNTSTAVELRQTEQELKETQKKLKAAERKEKQLDR